MPVDTEKIRDAFNKFEEEDFVSAKEILQQEIHKAKNDFIKTKLGLEKEVDESCGSKDGTKKKAIKMLKKKMMKESEIEDALARKAAQRKMDAEIEGNEEDE